MIRKNLVVLSASVLLGAMACGGSGGASVGEVCSDVCDKFVECDMLFGQTRDACVASCTGSQVGADQECRVNEDATRACRASINTIECSALSSGIPPECNVKCSWSSGTPIPG